MEHLELPVSFGYFPVGAMSFQLNDKWNDVDFETQYKLNQM
jgi:hypothetical protein